MSRSTSCRRASRRLADLYQCKRPWYDLLHLESDRDCEACDCAASIEDMALALAQHSREPLNSDEARRRCLAIRDALVHAGVYGSADTEQGTATAGSGVSPVRFRLSRRPFRFPRLKSCFSALRAGSSGVLPGIKPPLSRKCPRNPARLGCGLSRSGQTGIPRHLQPDEPVP